MENCQDKMPDDGESVSIPKKHIEHLITYLEKMDQAAANVNRKLLQMLREDAEKGE